MANDVSIMYVILDFHIHIPLCAQTSKDAAQIYQKTLAQLPIGYQTLVIKNSGGKF